MLKFYIIHIRKMSLVWMTGYKRDRVPFLYATMARASLTCLWRPEINMHCIFFFFCFFHESCIFSLLSWRWCEVISFLMMWSHKIPSWRNCGVILKFLLHHLEKEESGSHSFLEKVKWSQQLVLCNLSSIFHCKH